MTRPVCDQRSRDLLEDRGLVFDDDQDPAPTSLGSQRGPWPHYARFWAYPEPCPN